MAPYAAPSRIRIRDTRMNKSLSLHPYARTSQTNYTEASTVVTWVNRDRSYCCRNGYIGPLVHGHPISQTQVLPMRQIPETTTPRVNTNTYHTPTSAYPPTCALFVVMCSCCLCRNEVVSTMFLLHSQFPAALSSSPSAASSTVQTTQRRRHHPSP